MKTLLTLLALLLASPLHAQTPGDREQVRLAVLDYVEGFYTGASTRLVRSVSPEVFKSGYARGAADTTYRPSRMPYPAFMRFAEGVRNGRNLPPPDAPREIVIFD